MGKIPKEKEEEVNCVDEKIEVKFTEWEFDTLCQLIMGVNFPGTHVDIANNFVQKLKRIHKEWEQSAPSPSAQTQKPSPEQS